jgi:hypothetical protein
MPKVLSNNSDFLINRTLTGSVIHADVWFLVLLVSKIVALLESISPISLNEAKN